MKLDFTKINPNGNLTVLVDNKDKTITKNKYGKISSILMDRDYVFAEQAGFIEDLDLEERICGFSMMGGEFCVNATASVATLMAFLKGEEGNFTVKDNSSNHIIPAKVVKEEKGFTVTLNVPLKFQHKKTVLEIDHEKITADMICLEGITHFIVPVKEIKNEHKDIANKVMKIASKISDAPCTGVVITSQGASEILPLVYVKGPDSLVFERSCGSGSVAACLAEHLRGNTNYTYRIKQPSGGYVTIYLISHEDNLAIFNFIQHTEVVTQGKALIPNL